MASLRDSLVTLASRALGAVFPVQQEGPLSRGAAPRIAIIKPCCLGDMLLATPAISALRRAFPRGHIVTLTGRWARPAIEGNSECDAVVDLPASMLGAVRLLRRGHYDAAVVLDRSPLVALLPFLAGIPVRAGLDASGRGFSLTHRVPTDPLRHEAGLYLDVVKRLVPGASSPGLRFFPSPEDQTWAAERLPDGGVYVALHPGGGVNPGSTLLAKRWPPDRFASLARRLMDGGIPVLLVGGPGDVPASRQIIDAAVGPLLDLTGQTTFGQLGALLSRCRLFVGNDSGPMHLAVAMRVPVVAVFGPSSPVAYGPWSSRSLTIHHSEHCVRCRFRGGLVAECRNEFACIQAAGEDEVWSAIQALMASWSPQAC